MSTTSGRTPAPAHPPHAHKVSRKRLVRFEVVTDHCPQVILRVLGLFAQRGIILFNIAAWRNDHGMLLSLEIEALPAPAIESLVARVETLIMVRCARVVATKDSPIAGVTYVGSPDAHYLVPDSLGA